MTAARKFRAGIYAVEAINAFAAVIYLNYLYFYFRDHFGFDNKHNLALAALIGLVYTIASWQGGRLAARFGYFAVLKSGYALMAASLVVGAQLHTAAGQIAVACVFNAGLCLIWPTLEALVSEGEVAADAVGLYNITWAGTNAVAFFIGGTIIEKLGWRSIFYVPCALMLLQLAMVMALQKLQLPARPREPETLQTGAEAEPPPPAQVESFKHLSWLANPFAYLAINTLIAVIPGVAATFHLTPMMAGFACSLWCFIRLGMFILLWVWPGWHYRFDLLAAAYALLIVSFATILIVPSLPGLILAQIFFGGAIGLIYYSSLFYSMMASGAKSEHSGIHEAAIGMGNCLGPALGATALQFFPQVAHGGAMAVTALLVAGFGGLFVVKSRHR